MGDQERGREGKGGKERGREGKGGTTKERGEKEREGVRVVAEWRELVGLSASSHGGVRVGGEELYCVMGLALIEHYRCAEAWHLFLTSSLTRRR